MSSANSSNSSMISESPSSRMIVVPVVVLLLVVLVVVLMQLDGVARRWILSAARLRTKRRLEQRHVLNAAISQQIAAIRTVIVNQNLVMSDFDSERQCGLEMITNTTAITELVATIVTVLTDTTTTAAPLIVGISLDLGGQSSHTNEWMIYLAFPNPLNPQQYPRRVVTSLLNFSKQLVTKYKPAVTPKSVCLIVDASSGFTSDIISRIVQHTTTTSTNTSTTLIQEPAWMTTVAYLIQCNAILKEDAATILQVLLYLEIGNHATNDNLVIVLPGQSSTATLVPVLNQLYSNDMRILFGYDSCHAAISRGLSLQQQQQQNLSETVMPRAVTAVIPISPLTTLPNLKHGLATLPWHPAAILESYMSSVDAMLTLLDENNDIYSVATASLLTSETVLNKVLLFIMGSTSITEQTLDAAKSIGTDVLYSQPTLTRNYHEQITACVSLHDGIRTDSLQRFL